MTHKKLKKIVPVCLRMKLSRIKLAALREDVLKVLKNTLLKIKKRMARVLGYLAQTSNKNSLTVGRLSLFSLVVYESVSGSIILVAVRWVDSRFLLLFSLMKQNQAGAAYEMTAFTFVL